MTPIPPLIEKVAKIQSRRAYRTHWSSHGRLDVEDFEQEIYCALYGKGFWGATSENEALLYRVAKFACLELCRRIIWGHRRHFKYEEVSLDVAGYDKEYCKIFDSKYYEMLSLNQLLQQLDPFKAMFFKSLITGESRQIDWVDKLKVTEGRVAQIKKEILDRLIKLYKGEEKGNDKNNKT